LWFLLVSFLPSFVSCPFKSNHPNIFACFSLSISGLYSVVKYWQARGLSGFLVYKFALKRCDGQAPPPWEQADEAGTQVDITDTNGCGDC